MNMDRAMKKHSRLLSVSGFMLGISAPICWAIIRLIFFYDSKQTIMGQVFNDILGSVEHFAMYNYMGFGTASVLCVLGYLIGRNGDELRERAVELDILHKEVASQKEIFENRYKVLDNNIKNFHHISSKIHTSLNLNEILLLCAEGLHKVLGYERVNILMSRFRQDSQQLHFVTTAGTDNFDTAGIALPLDPRIGVIYKCMAEKKVFLIDDMSRYPNDYHLQPPYDNLAPLRSKSFILCPIVVKGEAIGAFGIDNKSSRRALNDSDVDTIMLFADQVASAITRINLLTSIDTLTSEMESSFAFLLGSRDEYSRNVMQLERQRRFGGGRNSYYRLGLGRCHGLGG